MNALKHLVGEQLGALGLAAVFTLAAGLLFPSLAVRPLEQRNRALDDALQGSGDGSAEGTQGSRRHGSFPDRRLLRVFQAPRTPNRLAWPHS